MEIKIKLNDKIMNDLNNPEVKYYLGDVNRPDAKTVEDFTGVLNKIIKNIWTLVDNSNQMDHLECSGVDNWSQYTHYDPYEDEEDD